MKMKVIDLNQNLMAVVFIISESKTMNKLLHKRYESGDIMLKEMLERARLVTVCLDEWTKKSLTSSFLGISACFYDPRDNVARHIVLCIKQIQHPHTGEMLKDAVLDTISEWNIDSSKVLMLVTDNGANVVKAMRLLREDAAAKEIEYKESEGVEDSDSTHEDQLEAESSTNLEEDDSDDTDSVFSEDDEDEDDENLQFPNLSFRHMPCMAHTLQLVIKKAFSVTTCSLVSKVRAIVGHIRRSGVAVQKLLDITGKTLTTDNATRWNSSYLMMKRLSELRHGVNQVIETMNIDSLRVAEWDELVNFVSLLEPFAELTNVLQSDSHSLSYIIPSLLDLQYHLQQFPHLIMLTRSMLQDLQHRFQYILNPSSDNFNPVPAAASLLDPTVAAVMFTDDARDLLEAAKSYIIVQVGYN